MDVSDNYSLRGRVFHEIREGILLGKYKQNEELKENTLGQELGVSRTPVREALRQLELEGLVKIIPNKGAYVMGLSERDIRDIYAARSALEGLCARWAVGSVTEKQKKELSDNVDLSEFYAARGDYAQVCELDTRFHEILYQASQSRIMEHMLLNFHHYVERIRRMSLATEGRAVRSNAEHRMILKAIEEKNPELAEELAHQHVLNTIDNIDNYGLKNLLEASGSSGQREAEKMEDRNGKD